MAAQTRQHARVLLLWIGFALAAAAVGVAVHALYDTVRREIEDQGQHALAQAMEKARARIDEYTASIHRNTLAELAGFHVDGLTPALHRWDEANAVVVGTFEWDAARGFFGMGSFPTERMESADLVSLWHDFASWRASHPEANSCDALEGAIHVVRYFCTLENPAFTAAALGYQSENLDMLTYAGHRVDPWGGWAASRTTGDDTWIFWYRCGPDAPVRGCLVNVVPILTQLRADLADIQLARVELVPHGQVSPGQDVRIDGSVALLVPGYELVGRPGELFLGKQTRVRFSALVVALLLGVFLLGVVFLVLYSRREVRDAERKTSFVSQVSHELRTPLTSIRMFADMLGAPGLPEEKRTRFAATISRESQRLGALIERLLTFNALERGKVSVMIETVDVVAVIRETLDDMDGTLREGGLRVEAKLPEDPVLALCDRTALKQALINLLDNALKYARDGGVVCISLVDAGNLVGVRVADRGPGIPARLRSQVFEPFVQGGRTLTDKSPGVGLGLSIARGLMRGAGGDLVLLPGDSGAVFEIQMPRHKLS